MSSVPTQAAMKATLQAYVDQINAGDAAGVTALFAPDAIIEDPIGSEPRTGKAIAQWFADTVAYQTRITPVAPHRGSHGNEALLVFDVEFTPPGGKRLRIRSADACRFDATGRITSLRAFWGPEDIGPAGD
ncbi:SnoaL-like domain-containing protein [Novosphingobium sp. ERN07]|uniref:steroid Delta-isomerase n=1 Tax=Novosphingobium sp. ERN07 TaxID=2726187 RepID=UPI001456C3B0|nr:steroid Delta-isomerase [Novosphingobium sp. ERN07]NLR70676.1 SnoaL-like domain-containing protein [Novosphingobium sp. ERN07]